MNFGKDKADTRVMCKYGEDCYQKNPEHRKKYKHPNKKSPSPSRRSRSPLGTRSRSPEKKEQKTNLPPSKSPAKNDVDDSKPAPGKLLSGKSSLEEKENGQSEAKVYVSFDGLETIEEKIKLVFLVEMPEDFYSLYSFCETLSPKSPHSALSSIGLELVGPFDLMRNDLKRFTRDEGLRHSRYYYDPPEFLTVLKGDDESLLHYGYFRDDPKEMPSFVGKNEAAHGSSISIFAGNIFGAVYLHVAKSLKSATPFNKMKITKLQSGIKKWASDKMFSLDSVTPSITKRKSKVVAKTFHGAGLVVPYNRKTEVGYRELAENYKTLKELFTEIDSCDSDELKEAAWGKIQHVITFANIANDECDFGTSLELGLNMFSFGSESLHKSVLHLMKTSYTLLGREEFGQIIEAHLKDRKKSYVRTIC